MSATANKIKALLGLAVSRAPTPPPISQLSFRIYPADTPTPPVDCSKKIDVNSITSADRKIGKAMQRAKKNSERAQMMSSASTPPSSTPPRHSSRWTASQLLKVFDYGLEFREKPKWSDVVEGRSADSSQQAWR
jgi:hypothetical protein